MPAAVALGVVLFVVVWLQREVVDAEAPTLLPPVEVDSPAGSSSLPAPQVPPELAPGDGEPGAGARHVAGGQLDPAARVGDDRQRRERRFGRVTV